MKKLSLLAVLFVLFSMTSCEVEPIENENEKSNYEIGKDELEIPGEEYDEDDEE